MPFLLFPTCSKCILTPLLARRKAAEILVESAGPGLEIRKANETKKLQRTFFSICDNDYMILTLCPHEPYYFFTKWRVACSGSVENRGNVEYNLKWPLYREALENATSDASCSKLLK